jgi:hypothetical protein
MADQDKIVKELRRKALSPNGKRKLAKAQKAAEETIKYLREAGRVDPEKMKQVFTI